VANGERGSAPFLAPAPRFFAIRIFESGFQVPVGLASQSTESNGFQFLFPVFRQPRIIETVSTHRDAALESLPRLAKSARTWVRRYRFLRISTCSNDLAHSHIHGGAAFVEGQDGGQSAGPIGQESNGLGRLGISWKQQRGRRSTCGSTCLRWRRRQVHFFQLALFIMAR